MHNIEYDDLFAENFPYLPEIAKRDVSEIGACLGSDTNFLPCEDPELDRLYICQRLPDGTGAVCRKIEGWGEWELSWYFEYNSFLTAKIETVVLRIDRAPLMLLRLNPVR